MLIDTHCHIHESDYPISSEDAYSRAEKAGIKKLICVATNIQSSIDAISFARSHKDVYASFGVHPHDTKNGYDLDVIDKSSKVVAVGEIGLDYYYNNSPKSVQRDALEYQIQIAIDYNLPIIFHVRSAFEDFWPIFDNFRSISGVLHSFTDNQANLDKALQKGLYIGVNGISTFSKDKKQVDMISNIPIERLLLESDAPFLTPAPVRGKVNEPAYVSYIAEFQAKMRGISVEDVAITTSTNANQLFKL